MKLFPEQGFLNLQIPFDLSAVGNTLFPMNIFVEKKLPGLIEKASNGRSRTIRLVFFVGNKVKGFHEGRIKGLRGLVQVHVVTGIGKEWDVHSRFSHVIDEELAEDCLFFIYTSPDAERFRQALLLARYIHTRNPGGHISLLLSGICTNGYFEDQALVLARNPHNVIHSIVRNEECEEAVVMARLLESLVSICEPKVA